MDKPTKLHDAVKTSTAAELSGKISDASIVTTIQDSGSDSEVQGTGDVIWATDGAGDIGGVDGAKNRPDNVFAKSLIETPALGLTGGPTVGEIKLQSITNVEIILAAGFTDSTYSFPAGSIGMGASVLVTTAIPDITSFDVGVPTDINRFAVGLDPTTGTSPGTETGGTEERPFRAYSSATRVRLTMNGAPPALTTGRVKITIWYMTFAAPTS